MKFRFAVAAVALSALALTGCAASTSHSGTVTDAAQQGTSRYYTIETQEAAGTTVYACDSYRELNCALLKKGDSISFVTYGDALMYKIVRAASQNA